MSDTPHTPGPWKATQDYHCYGDSVEATQQPFQIMGGDEEEDTFRRIAQLTDAWDEEQEANAHLIAAAPELLAALQTFVDDPQSYWMEHLWDFAREAVDKATGGAA